MSDAPEWPREIWMAERKEHDQGVVTAVLSEHATIARFDGDTARECEFHHYIDHDIHESQRRYFLARIEQLQAQHRAELEAVREALKEAIKEPISAYIYDTLYKLRCPVTSHSHQKTYEAAHAAMDALDLDEILKEARK